MSIEVYLLVNLIADGAILAATARALGCFDRRRIALASIACALYAVLAAACPAPWASVWMQIVLFTLISLWLTWRRGALLRYKTALLLCGGAVLAGGVHALLPGFRGPLGAACALVGAALLDLMLTARHPLRLDWSVQLSLEGNRRVARFPALIDTGNRLREPRSGQPVLIAEETLLRGVLPDDGWRELSFGAIGGGGRMRCFKPARLWIERGGRRALAPDVWVAVSPAPLPGDARALAPCEFAAFAQ